MKKSASGSYCFQKIASAVSSLGSGCISMPGSCIFDSRKSAPWSSNSDW